MVYLINYLRLEGSHNQERIPIANKEDTPPLGDELIDEEGDSKDERDASTEAGPVEGEDPEEDPSGEELIEEEDSKDDPNE